MTFWKRFRYYLIGVTLGIFISFFFFKGRGCAWLPENRVKDEILESVILYDDAIKCQMKCYWISESDLFELFYSGDVLFSESEPNGNPKTYVLQGKSSDGKEFKVTFALEDTISIITKINDGGEECKPCAAKFDEKLVELKLPEKTAKKMIGDRPLELNDLAQCQKECYELSNDDISSMIENGTFLGDISNRRKKPYPELFFAKDGYELVIELTQETARIINLVKKDNPDCGCY